MKYSVAVAMWPHGMPSVAWLTKMAQTCDQLGFDILFHGERPLTPQSVLDPFVALTHFASSTKQVRLGTGTLLLALRPPIQAAKAAASVDFLSNGRMVLAVSPGGDYAQEYESCGIPVSERFGRTREAIPLLRRLWQEPVVDYDGRYYHIREAMVTPKPIQQGGPPIWIGGRGEWSIDCAARLGDAWWPSFMPPKRYRDTWQRLCDVAVSAGRDPSKITPAVSVPFFCAPTFEQAYPVVSQYLLSSYGRTHDPEKLAGFSALGSLQQCQDFAGRLAEAGVRNFVAMMACPVEQLLDQLAFVAETVKPLQKT